MRVPESPVFSDTVALAWQCAIHGYLKTPDEITKISGSPLLEIQSGRGKLLASEFCFESTKREDPIARRLLMNSIRYLRDKN